MWPKVINKVKVTHQGQGHIKVKVMLLVLSHEHAFSSEKVYIEVLL